MQVIPETTHYFFTLAHLCKTFTLIGLIKPMLLFCQCKLSFYPCGLFLRKVLLFGAVYEAVDMCKSMEDGPDGTRPPPTDGGALLRQGGKELSNLSIYLTSQIAFNPSM